MNMADTDTSLIVNTNNCESMNRNYVEVEENPTDETNYFQQEIIINKTTTDISQSSSDICTQEEAVNVFLAGENKNDFDNDLLLSNIEDDGHEGISFKSENDILECNNQFENIENSKVSGETRKKLLVQQRNTGNKYICKSLKKRSIKCLNKMQIMEDVREGCSVQPPSPGHAEQRSGDTEVKTETKNIETDFEEQAVVDPHEDKCEKAIQDENGDADDDKTVEIKAERDNVEENYSSSSSPTCEAIKRKSENEELPIKRLKSEIHENFASRDKILNEFIELAECNSLEQLHSFSEQLLAEIKTLNDLAREKEKEWNNIIHLKKLKEELLLRMQRKKQVSVINEKIDYSDILNESQIENIEERMRPNISQSILKSNLTNPRSALRIPNFNGNSLKQRNILPKPQQNMFEMNGSGDFRQGKRLTLDVQSIIADYRQRHPEAVPRRGRRIRHTDGAHKSQNSILNFSSMALGSGAQVRQGSDVSNELNLLLNTINMNRQDGNRQSNGDPSLPLANDNVSFKDMLVQFAKLSQSERNEFIQNAIKPPPPYPEVTVHPVPTTSVPAAPANSLLHGILTKTPPKQTTKTSFSPTLARLLTAPERAAANNNLTSTPTLASNTAVQPSNMSISEILSSSKAHNEITITPVDTQYESTPTKERNMEEEETEDSADRLVIDENNEALDARKQPGNTDNSSEAGDEVPPCQGCNQKPAQFVCAGCGNQWYCSRDCQVSSWDEHSEVCSG